MKHKNLFSLSNALGTAMTFAAAAIVLFTVCGGGGSNPGSSGGDVTYYCQPNCATAQTGPTRPSHCFTSTHLCQSNAGNNATHFCSATDCAVPETRPAGTNVPAGCYPTEPQCRTMSGLNTITQYCNYGTTCETVSTSSSLLPGCHLELADCQATLGTPNVTQYCPSAGTCEQISLPNLSPSCFETLPECQAKLDSGDPPDPQDNIEQYCPVAGTATCTMITTFPTVQEGCSEEQAECIASVTPRPNITQYCPATNCVAIAHLPDLMSDECFKDDQAACLASLPVTYFCPTTTPACTAQSGPTVPVGCFGSQTECNIAANPGEQNITQYCPNTVLGFCATVTNSPTLGTGCHLELADCQATLPPLINQYCGTNCALNQTNTTLQPGCYATLPECETASQANQVTYYCRPECIAAQGTVRPSSCFATLAECDPPSNPSTGDNHAYCCWPPEPATPTVANCHAIIPTSTHELTMKSDAECRANSGTPSNSNTFIPVPDGFCGWTIGDPSSCHPVSSSEMSTDAPTLTQTEHCVRDSYFQTVYATIEACQAAMNTQITELFCLWTTGCTLINNPDGPSSNEGLTNRENCETNGIGPTKVYTSMPACEADIGLLSQIIYCDWGGSGTSPGGKNCWPITQSHTSPWDCQNFFTDDMCTVSTSRPSWANRP